MLEEAVRHHQQGRLAEAEALYRQIVQHDPRNAAAWNLLGVLAGQMNRNDVAIDLIRRAMAIEPDNAGHHCNLGNVLLAAGRADEAIDAYRNAIALQPRYVGAIYNLGNAWMAQQRFEDAATAYRAVIDLSPGSSEAHSNLGNALNSLGRVDEAIAAHRQAVALSPQSTDAHYNLAVALQERKQFAEAESSYRRAIELHPDFAIAWNNLGNALKRLGRFDEAIAAYRRAIQIDANFAEAHNNLGNSLRDRMQLTEAMSSYATALSIKPDFADALNNRANVFRVQGKLDDAIASLNAALRIKPDLIDALNNLGNTYNAQGRLDEAIDCYDRALTLDPRYYTGLSNRIYTMLFSDRFDAAAILAQQQIWDARYAKPLAPASDRAIAVDAHTTRRLRIGYVSPDFRDHVIGRNLVPLFREHDHQRFEIFCYANQLVSDSLTPRFRSYADHWREIGGMSDDDAVAMIRADRIDILIDLALHMGNNRLLTFARKPAPVQGTFAGYPGGTGLSAIDFRLTDPYLDPPENDSHYVERSIRLPHSFWCYDPLGCDVAASDLPAGRNGHVTFGCLNNFCKITPRTIELWSRVLRVKRDARLILLSDPGSHRQMTRDQFERLGVDPNNIEFVDRQERDDYLRLYHRIDIGLDTFPYNGHTTSLDSLWMGVPVVTLIGETAVGRAGFSQLSNIDLKDLAAANDEQFVKIAVELARDLDRLAGLRASLRQRMEKSPLMDAKSFARGIESAYLQMWQGQADRQR